MKRVLYNTSIADPFVQVAQKLQRENGYEPVYWIGFDYDHSDEIVPKTFPNCIYQSYPDAWKGIFSDSVKERAAECYLDVDLLNRLARYELQAIKMMDRMDFDRFSFNFMERERHYLNLIKYWMAVLDLYQIDVVVSAVNPHRVYDYVLYLLCKDRGLKFICIQYTICPARTFATDNVYSIGDLFDCDYNKYKAKETLSKEFLPEDLRAAYDKVQRNYEDAKPVYMNMHNTRDKKLRNVFRFAHEYWHRYSFSERIAILKKGSLSTTMFKNRKYSLENSHNTLWEAAMLQKNKIKYNKMMNNYYSSIAVSPVEGEKYIFVPLHYQPEASTSPVGDLYVNQRLVVETLLRNTPEDYYIYVKEHPQQFQSHMLGQTSRIKEFYSDLLQSKRVRFISLQFDSFSVMSKAKAVATVTGTVGWEAVMHRIPVIVFGMIWNERMPGVLRVTDSESAKGILPFIEGYEYSEHNVLAYLMSVADNTVLAYHYKGEKEVVNMEESTAVNNLSKLILFFE